MQLIRMLLNADSYVDVDANGDDTINQLINQSINQSLTTNLYTAIRVCRKTRTYWRL